MKDKWTMRIGPFLLFLWLLPLSLFAQGRCGDGVIQGAEQCDRATKNSNTRPDACRLDCTSPRCGDGVIDSNENCDDGNTADGDSCPATCTIEAVCGDGVVQPGEQCDDGNANAEGGPCLPNCTAFVAPPTCGNNIVEASEQCDGGKNCKECRKTTIKVPPPSASDLEPENTQEKELDPNRAFQLAVTCTMAGPPGLGLIYGPSVGHFYAGEVGRGVAMTALRAVVVGSMFVTRRNTFDATDPLAGLGLLASEGLLLTTLVAVDWLDASNAVRRAKGQK